MNKLIILFLVASSFLLTQAEVKQLGKIKLKDTVVTKVQSNTGTITVDNDSNISTDYRGMSYTNFVVDISSSNKWYFIDTEDINNPKLVIIPWSRETATIICNDYFENIFVRPVTNSVAGLRQSVIEFIYTNTTNGTYEVSRDPSINLGINNTVFGKQLTGPSTNLVSITGITDNLFIAESVSVIESK